MHERAAEFAERAREAHGLDVAVEEFPEGTKTAADAADALGCSVAQIASSIVFAVDGDPAVDGDHDRTDLAVVVTSGANHVSEAKLAGLLGVEAAAVSPATPETVRAALGWAIGGVPPLCHDASVPRFFDETLLDHETVWAAAGTPQAVFPVDPERLHDLTGARGADVAE